MITINKTSVVETNDIGDGTVIDEFCVIRKNVVVGKNVHVYPHVVISDGCIIGDNTRLYPGTLIGKIPDGAGALARTPSFSRHVSIGSNCAIGPNAVVYYDVEIGKNTLIGDAASIRENCNIGSYTIIGRHVCVNYECTIGNHTKIMDFAVLESAVVGDDVFISMHVSTANDNKFYLRKYDSKIDLGPKIDDHASIGENATLLPNIRIGRWSLVGAGSVVTKDVPEKAVVMGIPAKIVRYLDDINGESK